MDIPQALQEMQRLKGLYESRQISPEMYVQAIDQLQIQDAYDHFWHVDGTTLRWYRYDGQNWIEQAPPFVPPSPSMTGVPQKAASSLLGAIRNSYSPLWIGLGILLVGIIIVAAVLLSGAVPTPWFATPTPTPTITPTPTDTPTPSPTVRPTSTRITFNTYTPRPTHTPYPTLTPRLKSPTPTPPSASGLLQPNGPWLLSKDESNLYRIQVQQTDKINNEPVLAPYNLTDMIAPSGGRIAFITSSDPNQMRGLKLIIYDVARMKVENVIAITSTKTEPGPNALPGDPAVEAIRAITVAPGLAWSPNGRQLAFIGVIDGPSSDLYLYSVDTQKVTRLSDGPSQAFGPSWSPDGKYITQFGASSFGTGAGFSMLGAWATRADNSGSIELYQPKSNGEVGLGWANANTYLVYSFNAMCGHHNLRAIEIQPLKVTTLFAGCFNDIDFDSTYGNVIFGITQGQTDICSCASAKTDAGLYMISLNGTLKSLATGDISKVAWLKNASVIWGWLEGKGPTIFHLTGRAVSLPTGLPARQPLITADGKSWVWIAGTGSPSVGIWIGSESSAYQMSFLPVSSAVWDKANSILIFLSNNKLYAMSFPGYKLTALVNTNPAQQIDWITP
jgi:hypothetical protein